MFLWSWICFLALYLPGTSHLSYSVLAGSHTLKLSHLILITWRNIFMWSMAIAYMCKFLSSCILCQFELNVLEADMTAWFKKVKDHFDSQTCRQHFSQIWIWLSYSTIFLLRFIIRDTSTITVVLYEIVLVKLKSLWNS